MAKFGRNLGLKVRRIFFIHFESTISNPGPVISSFKLAGKSLWYSCLKSAYFLSKNIKKIIHRLIRRSMELTFHHPKS